LYLMETIMWSATQEIETSFRLPTPAWLRYDGEPCQ
jgi:hypothetical protein